MTEDPRDVIAREPMHRQQLFAIAIATALNALDGFDVLSISFASPGIAADWGVDRAALGVVLSMELIGMAIGAFLLGMLADRVGRRLTTLISLLIMASGMGLASVAPGVIILSVIRFYTGLGIGGMLAATNAIVAEYANSKSRNLAVAVMAGGYPIGAIVGGTIATNLLATTGRWQSVFEFGAFASIAFLPLVFWFVPETVAFLCDRQPRGALEKINRMLKAQGRSVLNVLPPRREGKGSIPIAEAFSPGMARVTILLIVTYFAHIMTFYFLMKWTPKIVADLGFAASAAGGVLVWANVGGASGSVLLSVLTRRFDVRHLVISSMVCGAVAVATFGQDLSTLTALSIVAALAGFFTNGATAGLYAVFASSFPSHLRAGGTGLVIGIGRGGAALGPVMAGLLFSWGWPLYWVAPMLATGSLFGALALLCVRPNAAAD